MRDLSIYIHWPYCKSKCPYCDFYSQVSPHINQDDIISGYLQQMDKYAEIVGDRHIKSIFFGGGTPSLIHPQNIEQMINKIDNLWGISSDVEISLEANPNTHKSNLFADLKNAGINRLSLGIQALDDNRLRFLGRSHNLSQAYTSIEDMQYHFDNNSIDIMYALPQDTLSYWQETLQKIISFDLKHISLYQLTIEEGTKFYQQGIKPVSQDLAAELYSLSETYLADCGYYKYEVSNYAKQGYASVHNQVYWQGGDYIGIGKSAHGRLQIDGNIFAQTDNINLEKLTPTERAEELILMGLRLTAGINKHQFYQNCGLELPNCINQTFKQQAINEGLLSETKDIIQATPSGFLLLDWLINGLCS